MIGVRSAWPSLRQTMSCQVVAGPLLLSPLVQIRPTPDMSSTEIWVVRMKRGMRKASGVSISGRLNKKMRPVPETIPAAATASPTSGAPASAEQREREKRLVAALSRREMTLTDLSERVNITVVNLAVLKNGRARAIRFSTLAGLCEALDCPPGGRPPARCAASMIADTYPCCRRKMSAIMRAQLAGRAGPGWAGLAGGSG